MKPNAKKAKVMMLGGEKESIYDFFLDGMRLEHVS